MRAPLSVIIPTLNAGADLPATLACLIEGLEMGLLRELIISDGGSDDATPAVARDFGAELVTGAPGRGGQLRRGARMAGGDWLLFLHADTHLSSGWAAEVNHHMRSSQMAGYFRLRFRASGVQPAIIAAGGNARARLGLPYGDQGLLISRTLYDQVGGYRDMALMEDVAMARALWGRLVLLNAEAATDPGRYQRTGWFRGSALNLWRLVRYLCGADPDKLARSYNG